MSSGAAAKGLAQQLLWPDLLCSTWLSEKGHLRVPEEFKASRYLAEATMGDSVDWNAMCAQIPRPLLFE